MNFLIPVLVVFGICFIGVAMSAPATNQMKSSKPEKRETSIQQQHKPPSSEDMADVIFADETKKKRSQEVIMFGNQQNKPAGMVDDGLVRFADKKAQKRQNNDGGNADQDDVLGSREILPPGIQPGSADNQKVPVISEVGQMNDAQDDGENDQQQDNAELDDAESYLPRGFLPDSQLNDVDDSTPQNLEADPSYLSRDWSEYNTGNRYYGNDDDIYRRRRRNAALADRVHHRRLIRKRSLLTPLDQLMNSRRGAGAGRWKRDVKLSKDDVVGLLAILAAAEAAKERQQSRQHSLTDLESAYLDSLSETRPAESADLGDLNRYLSTINRYDDDDEDNDVDLREVPDWGFVESEPSLQIRRRSKPFYPPVDYRSLGVIGAKKRSTSHYYPGMWGRFESERKRSSVFNHKDSGMSPDFGEFRGRFRDPSAYNVNDDDDDDELIGQASPNTDHFERSRINDDDDGDKLVDVDDDDVDGGGGVGGRGGGNQRDEELYSLGELLNGNDVEEEDRYPLYKRLI